MHIQAQQDYDLDFTTKEIVNVCRFVKDQFDVRGDTELVRHPMRTSVSISFLQMHLFRL